MEHLTKRAGSNNWYYRETTPSDVRDLLVARDGSAPAEVWRSLGTGDFRLAKAQLPEVQAEQHRKWAKMRIGTALVSSVPSMPELVDAVVQYVHAKFIERQRNKLRTALTAGTDLATVAAERRNKIAQVELYPTPEDLGAMELVARTLCRDLGWDLAPGPGVKGERWGELVAMVTKAIQHARGLIVDTLEGRTVPIQRASVAQHIADDRRPVAKQGEALADLFKLYKADRLRDGKSADTLEAEGKIVAHFIAMVGSDRSVADIGRADIREFKRALARVPRRWASLPELKGMSIADAATAWEKRGGKGRSPRTVHKELSAISALFAWLIKNAYYDSANPTRDFFDRIDKAETKYPPYREAQLKAVFGSPLFVGCDVDKPHLAGTHQIRDWRYWLPLCALYSGARAGEIAQLLCSDVRQEEEVWVFDFNDKATGENLKSLKTRAARRVVPIHPALHKLGFGQYVATTRQAGHLQLFPEIKPGPRGDMSYAPSKFWQRYLMRINVKERGLGLHSFRHTFTDECRRCGVAKEILRALLGHADSSITGHYGTLADGTLEQRVTAITAIAYGGLHAGL